MNGGELAAALLGVATGMELAVLTDLAGVTERRPGMVTPFQGTFQPVDGGVKACDGFLDQTR